MTCFHGDTNIFSVISFSLTEQLLQPILSLLFLCFSLFTLCFLFISLYKRLKQAKEVEHKSTQKPVSAVERSLSLVLDKTQKNSNTHQLFVEILNSNITPKWISLVSSYPSKIRVRDIDDELVSDGSELDNEGNLVVEDFEKNGETKFKKKKKRAKKKKQNSQADDYESHLPLLLEKNSLDSVYPFTSSSSLTQRKIKQQYDQLRKSHDSKALTLTQVGQFANCLIEARNNLQHKLEVIQRKFTITKALLFKADRSSFDRLSQKIYRLQAEQKRLEEDAVVYDKIQQQLKLSPAYMKMLEMGARVELQTRLGHLEDNSTDSEFSDISFEEFLEQEKKDTFWQRNRKLKSCTT